MESITAKHIKAFEDYLISEEKSAATVEKYSRDIKAFTLWLNGAELNKISVLEYKSYISSKYAVASVNSMLSSLNSFFIYNGRYDLRVKAIRVQKQIFSHQEKELTKTDYEKLLSAAQNKKDERLYYLIQTICATGIRVSELKYVTVAAVCSKEVRINCKGKMRVILLPHKLCELLKRYAKANKISSGSIFVSKKGNPLDRSHIWQMLKALCTSAGVSREKVFPHNLRHLFARTYYSLQRDIVRLADILGHTSINTTRIYTMESGEVHRKQIQRLGLLRC